MKKYKPKPMDSRGAELPPSLSGLLEALAKNAHDTWALERIRQGWVWGPGRNDETKTHPCLVEYEDLPDSEKEFDRSMASQTLRAILGLGYEIQEPEIVRAGGECESPDRFLEWLNGPEPPKAEELIALWTTRGAEALGTSPRVFFEFGKRLVKSGENLVAFDVLSEGLRLFGRVPHVDLVPGDLRPLYLALRQQQALALAECGAAEKAGESLRELADQGVRDGETLGILARTYKDVALRSKKPAVRTQNFRLALEIYRDAFHRARESGRMEDAYYNGINAATLSLLTGRGKQAREIAATVRDLCLGLLESQGASAWLSASLGEALLVLGDPDRAGEWYARAVRESGGAWREVSSMRRQASLILKARDMEDACLKALLPLPEVVVFSGLLADGPGETEPRFDASGDTALRRAMAEKLKSLNAGISFSSAACGADILFLEEMIARKGEVNIVLPFEREHFIRESVAIARDPGWVERFENCLEKAARVVVAGQYNPLLQKQDFRFADLYLYGAALARARRLGTGLSALAVWDGVDKGNPAGTASAVGHWLDMGQAAHCLSPRGEDLGPADGMGRRRRIASGQSMRAFGRQVRHYTHQAMMFADVKGYSGLDEEQFVRFSVHFPGLVARLCARYEKSLVFKRTAGDGLFFVFSDVGDAARLALDLGRAMAGRDWSRHGLPRTLPIRISLDAGSCCSYRDHVTGQRDFCGASVVRAARIEPITPPGLVYASEAYMALARALGVRGVRFEYAGTVALPKGYGTIPVYHVKKG